MLLYVSSENLIRFWMQNNGEPHGYQGESTDMASEEFFFRQGEVCKIISITPRQLQYWEKTGLVVPSFRTQGGHGRYSFQDLIACKTAKKLLEEGVSLQRIRKSVGSLQKILPSIKRPLAELTLVATGDLVLVFYQDTAFEAVSGQQWIIHVAEIESEALRWKRQAKKISRYRRMAVTREVDLDSVRSLKSAAKNPEEKNGAAAAGPGEQRPAENGSVGGESEGKGIL
jgi:DNA-binding transcriptional MerR regulator